MSDFLQILLSYLNQGIAGIISELTCKCWHDDHLISMNLCKIPPDLPFPKGGDKGASPFDNLFPAKGRQRGIEGDLY
jgi:hypothetical protein